MIVYVGLLFLFMGLSPISELIDDYLFLHSSSSAIKSLSFLEYINHDQLSGGIIFVGIGVALIIYGWKKPHAHRLIFRLAGIILVLVSLLLIFDRSITIRNYYYNTTLGRFIASLEYMIPGIILYIYNIKKSGDINDEPEVILEDEIELPKKTRKSDTLIGKTISQLEEVRDTKLSHYNIDLYENLSQSIDILSEIENENYEIDSKFLKKIGVVSDIFLDIENTSFRTEKTRKILVLLVDSYFTINEALENIYDRNFESKATEIEDELKELKTNLEIHGNINSPFEKLKEKIDATLEEDNEQVELEESAIVEE